MYCMSCGKQLPDGASFCNKCGAAVIPEPTEPKQFTQSGNALQQSSEVKSVQPQNDPTQNTVKDTENQAEDKQIFLKSASTDFEASVPSSEFPTYPHSYHQLGGWLGFIAWMEMISGVLLALSCLTVLPQISTKHFAGAAVLVLFIQLTCFSLAAFISIKLFFMIKNKDSRFLRFYEIQSLLYIAGFLFMLFCSEMYGRDTTLAQASRNYGIPAALTQGFNNAIISVIYFLIWMAYFRKSVRVRTYMGNGQYLQKSIFSKNCVGPMPADAQPYMPSQQHNSADTLRTTFLIPGIVGVVGIISGIVMMIQGESMNEKVDMNDVMNEAFSTGRVNSAPGNGMVELGQVVIVLGCLLVIVAAIMYFYQKSSGKNK